MKKEDLIRFYDEYDKHDACCYLHYLFRVWMFNNGFSLTLLFVGFFVFLFSFIFLRFDIIGILFFAAFTFYQIVYEYFKERDRCAHVKSLKEYEDQKEAHRQWEIRHEKEEAERLNKLLAKWKEEYRQEQEES